MHAQASLYSRTLSGALLFITGAAAALTVALTTIVTPDTRTVVRPVAPALAAPVAPATAGTIRVYGGSLNSQLATAGTVVVQPDAPFRGGP